MPRWTCGTHLIESCTWARNDRRQRTPLERPCPRDQFVKMRLSLEKMNSCTNIFFPRFFNCVDKIAYDEESGEWRRTYGYKRANNELDQWAIEHKEGDGTQRSGLFNFLCFKYLLWIRSLNSMVFLNISCSRRRAQSALHARPQESITTHSATG